ncbi:ATP-binding cassette domain-containing protein [Pseudolysinimonas yzui]|uniref:ABC transporter ATP-binding protein n=1 Tax=Pseudolysinimonas yzui TaxID=2708254 RepID=A0A8J3M5L1_9MICO|nr:ATP-binding cassette domain-containing protein [Pseudolysinimonas yzui]GHF22149.1 ABC transporter ATP-binding protein [Pseudolysinimonas yzui]
MSTGQTLVFDGVTKHFGPVAAVEGLDFTVEPGRVTGFLGPNGAGKTTTLRMLLGLVAATSGTATIGGKAYRDLENPMRVVGASLEAAFHPGRSGRAHLAVTAAAAGIPRDRVTAVLEQTGMAPYADRRVGGYSMGMRQRLGLATALLGDPGVLVLDEPINGLDPEGIRWIRSFLQALAAEGRTVLVSSHLLSEVQQTVDDVVVIAGGKLRYVGTLAALEGTSTANGSVVDTPDRAVLIAALEAAGHDVRVEAEGLVVELAPVEVGRIALAAGVALSALAASGAGLEDEFLALVADPERAAEGGRQR